MDQKVTEAREKLLDAILKHTGLPDEKSASCVRNWATAYGILTDKWFAENRVSVSTDATGFTRAVDGLGRRVDLGR